MSARTRVAAVMAEAPALVGAERHPGPAVSACAAAGHAAGPGMEMNQRTPLGAQGTSGTLATALARRASAKRRSLRRFR